LTKLDNGIILKRSSMEIFYGGERICLFMNFNVKIVEKFLRN